MKCGILLELRRLMRCATTLVVMVLVASPIETVIAEQPGKSEEESHGSTEKPEQRKTSLRIEVLVADPEKEKSPQRAVNAIVKIQGEDEPYRTGKDGKTPSFGTSPGAKTLVIHISGANTACRVSILIKGDHQDVTVLVAMAPKVKCTLQP